MLREILYTHIRMYTHVYGFRKRKCGEGGRDKERDGGRDGEALHPVRLRIIAGGDGGDGGQDERRMLHAVYRVGNLEETVEYYKKHFGMKVLRARDIPEACRHPRIGVGCCWRLQMLFRHE